VGLSEAAREGGPSALADEAIPAESPPASETAAAAESAQLDQPRKSAGATPAPAATTAADEQRPTEPQRPSLGRAPGPIQPTDSFAVAGRKAMWLHVSRMLDREDAVRDPAQTDALKRYRVATRRLRAAIRVFREAYPKRETKSLRTALADLAGALGRVRDLDVRVEELDRWASDRGDGTPEAVKPLRSALAAQRRAAATVLARKLDARNHHRLLTALVDFVTADDDETGLHDGSPERTTRDHAASSIWSAYELVRAYASVVRWADLPTLHGLRIEAKRLRYTLEFLGHVLGPEREWVLERLVALQNHLGALNDATLAVAAIRAFLGERHAGLAPEERAAIVTYLGDRERELGRLRRSVGRAWRPVVSITFARRLARAVVVRPT
jgi:triphosphatase